MNLVSRAELQQWLNQSLSPDAFKDYAPNGLQLQGKPFIKKIVLGVTASKALLEKAAQAKADTVIVHHGWFWRNEDSCIVNQKYERIAYAIKQELNVFGYHLPLDAHPEWGNNTQLGVVLELQILMQDGKPVSCGEQKLVWLGEPPLGKERLGDFVSHIEEKLGRQVLFIGDKNKRVKKVAWCTGGAQGFFDVAINAGADVFITGEASEQVYHMAQESGVAYIAAGHHATERYGIQALGRAIKQQFPSIEVDYIEIYNPI
ncbi:Nif3-like dinuclear metal center hexameric protein [Pelistega sp. MC2]|uniref:Nif3-like dinuclear metal center hexameric protein n=1 Tax=Pelistega sp. MC2 TaxID=1720297 RepID=UPI0008DADBC9|nr:Nif3-like dinuclear metal center hexameric protein [Pelistega sp. MC2]